MAVNPFFADSGSPWFDARGRPALPGIFEFRRSDGMKLIYTLGLEEREGEEPRLRVVRCSRMSEFPSPAHALDALDGTWTRWLGPGSAPGPGGAEPGGPETRDPEADASEPGRHEPGRPEAGGPEAGP